MLAIVEQFPGYFAGSNADPPIVGGSILHTIIIKGRHVFPMEVAPVEESFNIEGFEAVSLGIGQLAHVGSTFAIRRQGTIIALADHILTAWRGYSDPAVQVLAASGRSAPPYHYPHCTNS